MAPTGAGPGSGGSGYNISHVINSLSFGEYFPGMHYPLDGVTRMLPSGTGMHQYFVKLVPTVYVVSARLRLRATADLAAAAASTARRHRVQRPTTIR